jgi:CubicO group peptidase (beta-lactamase class C family)
LECLGEDINLKIPVTLLALVTCLALAPPDRADPPAFSPEQSQELDGKLEQIRAHAKVPGLAVGIVDRGRPAYARGFGVRDLATGAPVTADTLFHIASISKTFTATAIMQLVEQGKLTLDARAERYLPAFEGTGVTLEQLLTHTAGLDDWIDPSGTFSDAAVASYVKRIAHHEPAYPPGHGWGYSDADFNILGAVIEAVSGQSYPDYVQQHVLANAGMTASSPRLPADTADFAWPHHGEHRSRRAKQHPWDRVFIPSSGIESSVNDLMRWAIVNLERDPALLTPASYAALFERRMKTEWPQVSMALGWQLEKRGNEWLPRHPGGDPGFRTLLTLYPGEQRAIVILSNGESTPRWEIRDAIEAVLNRQDGAEVAAGR